MATATQDLFESPDGGKSSYSAKDIEVLEGLEPVRRRPGMYVGGTIAKLNGRCTIWSPRCSTIPWTKSSRARPAGSR